MKFDFTSRSAALRSSSALSLCAVLSAGALFATPAYAQDTQNCPAGQVRNDEGDCEKPEAEAKEGDIVVTGSRIRRDQFNTADSVQVITRNESTQAGFNSTSEVLQSTKVTGGTAQINDLYGGFVVNGGPGVNTVSLRGLGTTRTLVLMNGRRISPAGSRGSVGSADLNVLPNAAIDRVEILNTGASSIYGSDAVAGVINIVTRQDMNGIEFEAQHNVPEVGAGITRRYSATGGFSTDRFRVMGSLEYFRQDAMEYGDRKFSQCPTQYYGTDGTNFGAGDFIDPTTGKPKCFTLENGGVTVNTIGTPLFYNTGGANGAGVNELSPGAAFDTYCNRWRPNASVTGGPVPGFECVGGVYFNPVTGQQVAMDLNIRDTFSPSLLKEDLISPKEIYTAYGQASYDLEALGNAQLYAEVLFNRRQSNQDGQRQFTIDYPLGSPLIPAGLRYGTRFTGPTAATNGLNVGIRVFADYGIYNNRQRNDFMRFNGGIRGDMLGTWRYDLFAQHSKSKSKYTTDLILTDRLARSFDVVASGGSFVCRNTADGCVAAPTLTAAVVGGQFPQAWFDYVVEPVTGKTEFTETTFAASFDGPLFALPGGMVQMAVGAEYRKSEIDDTPGIDSQNNNLYGFTSSTPTRGKDSVWEVYGELELPLIRDSFIYDLTLNGSARYTEYESYGGDFTYKLGGMLSPTKWLGFRGSYGTSYRAPALFEQFLGRTTGFLNQQTDPCYDMLTVTNPLVRAQCQADGLPADFRQNSGVTVIGLGGAEAGLKSETSTALTFGGVFQPDLGSFGELSISVDYFKVKVDNGVARLSASQVLSQCYNNPERTTCRPELISRDANFVLTVVQSYVNISDTGAEGIDYNLRFTTELGGLDLRFNAALTQYLERYNRTFPTDAKLDVVGFLNNPEWTGTFDTTIGQDNWSIRYSVEWVDSTSSQAYAEQFGYDPLVYKLSTKDYFLHSASFNLAVTDNFGLTLGVRNIFDKEPPMLSSEWDNLIGNAPLYSGYQMQGRTFFLNLTVKK